MKSQNIESKPVLPAILSTVIFIIITIILFPSHTAAGLFMNAMLLIPLWGLLLLLFRRYEAALITSSVLMLLIYYINRFVYSTRGTQIHFNDFYCISDAMAVENKYPLVFSLKICLTITAVVIINAIYIYMQSIKYGKL